MESVSTGELVLYVSKHQGEKRAEREGNNMLEPCGTCLLRNCSE